MLTRLFDQSPVEKRTPRILAQDVKDDRGGLSVSTKHGKRVLARAIACSLLTLGLSSCTIPDLRPAQSGPEVPPAYDGAVGANANTSDNSSRLGIDEFFNDPILTRLIDQAMLGNRELLILEEEVQIAQNDILARQGAFLPFVSFGAGAGVEKPSKYTVEGAAEDELTYPGNQHFPDPLPNFVTGLNVAWQLDIWRELRNARDAAMHRYVSACERRNYFVTHLVAEIAENYYSLMALDIRLQTLGKTIELQEQSLKISKVKKEAGRGTELAVQRFQAEVQKNQSETLIVKQEIVEAENRINLLLNRYPQPVERMSDGFLELNIHALSIGFPAQLLENRPDIRQAERELEAAGLDVKVAKAHFYPRVDITAGVGYEAFNPTYMFLTPESLIGNVAGNLVVPLINTKAIQAEYLTANAKQLQAVYNYQRVILTAFTEVINRVSKVENYRRSIEIKRQQLESLQASVDTASKLFQSARTEYVEVLLAQRDLMEARMVLIETKKEQLAAVVNAYQALGGGDLCASFDAPLKTDVTVVPKSNPTTTVAQTDHASR
jgi:outer membrane protein, multidrug efflux system